MTSAVQIVSIIGGVLILLTGMLTAGRYVGHLDALEQRVHKLERTHDFEHGRYAVPAVVQTSRDE